MGKIKSRSKERIMWATLLKALPAVASIIKSIGGLFSSIFDHARKKKAKDLKDEISESIGDLKKAKTDDEISDAVKRLNGLQ
jgi:hypothetical protein